MRHRACAPTTAPTVKGPERTTTLVEKDTTDPGARTPKSRCHKRNVSRHHSARSTRPHGRRPPPPPSITETEGLANLVTSTSCERRAGGAVERRGESGAAGVGDLGAVEVELLELRQSSSRLRQRTYRLGGGGAMRAMTQAFSSATESRTKGGSKQENPATERRT